MRHLDGLHRHGDRHRLLGRHLQRRHQQQRRHRRPAARAGDRSAGHARRSAPPSSPPPPTVGTSIADKATVTGGYNPTGTVTFNLYANSTATGTPLFTDTETLSGGTATSNELHRHGDRHRLLGRHLQRRRQQQRRHQPAPRWSRSSITPATPTINTSQQPASAIVGTSIADKATVTAATTQPGPSPSISTTTRPAAAHALFTDTETLSRRHGHLAGLHDHGDRHRLLGRHLQRRHQQQRRHQPGPPASR